MVQALWVQEIRCNKRLGYKKVLGTRNPADVLTKHVPGDLLRTHLHTIGVEHRGGRAETAPTLDWVEAFTQEWVVDTSTRPSGSTSQAGSERTTNGTTTDGRELEELLTRGKKVRFGSKVYYREVASTGNCLPTKRAGKTRRDPLRSELLTPTGAGASTESCADARLSENRSVESPVLSFERPAWPRNEGGALISRAPQATTDVHDSAAVLQ